MPSLRVLIYGMKEAFFAERARWFVWTPVLFGVGIGVYFALSVEISKWIVLGVIEALIVLAILFRRRMAVLFVLLPVFIVVMGFTTAMLHTIYISKSIYPIEEQKLYIQGRIAEMEYNYRGKQRLIVDDVKNFERESVKGRFRLTLTSPDLNLKVGQCFEAVAEIGALTPPFLVGGYQPQRQLFYQGISGVGYIPSRVLPIECGYSRRFADFVHSVREKIAERIFDVLPKEEAGVVAAIAMGQKGKIKNEVKTNYRDAGLAHFLSISGLHMSMIAGLMFFFIRMLIALVPAVAVRVDGKKISAVAALMVSVVYLMISGAEIPAQRAFIMTTIVLLGVLFDRVAISMRVLAFAAFAVLTISPEALIGPSFQMSFAAVIALVAFYEKYAGGIGRFLKGSDYRYDSMVLKLLKICWIYIIGILLTDLVASVTTSVFAVYHFNRIAVYTTIGNMLSGPIIGFVVMPFLLFSLLLMPLGLDVLPLKVSGWGVGLINDITEWVAGLPYASVQVRSFPTWSMVAMVFGGLWLCIWQTKWRRWGWIGVVVGFLGMFTVSNPDIIVNGDVSAVAVKAENGEMVVLPSRGNHTLKNVWREKTASRDLDGMKKKKLKEIYHGESVDKGWIDLVCVEEYCEYKGRVKIYKSGSLEGIEVGKGASVYIGSRGIKVKTLDEYVGARVWN